MEVRRSTCDDLPEILAISNRAALETAANFAVEPETLADWQQSFDETQERMPWLVASGADGVLGFAKASPWKGRCAYEYSVEISVYVRPEHHGKGVGKALYRVLLETLHRQGYRSVVAGIALPNEVSVRLHESFGLRKVGTLKSIGWKFGRWHDVGLWQGGLGDGAGAPGPLRGVSEVLGT